MFNPRKQKFKKLIGGIEIRNKLRGQRNTIGTLGMIVYDKETGIPLGLSNQHILEKSVGSDVYQPGINGKRKRSRNRWKYVIGTIYRVSSKYDCAVFKIDVDKRPIDTEKAIHGIDGFPVGVVKWEEGMKVKKVGKNTGLTYGVVKGDVSIFGKEMTEGTFCIIPDTDYHDPNFEISIGGDSGAVWVTNEENYRVVGLHYAGEHSKVKEKYEFANAIDVNVVIDELQIDFVKK